MPSNEEKIAQLEAAFRRRFFPHVPKVETPQRSQWDELKHDNDRLSRALAAYALVALIDLNDVEAAGAIIDGGDDFGIDAIYFDKSQYRLYIVQSKFKRAGAAPSQAENLKTINGIRALLSRRFNEFNATFQRKLDDVEEALDTPGIVIDLVLLYLGENFSPHVTNDLNALRDELNVLAPRMSWEPKGLNDIYNWLVAEQHPDSVTLDLTLENWAPVQLPRKAIYGQLNAQELAQLVQTHGKALFEKNIRHYLGTVGVNLAITETVRRKPADFFYLNNGLTALAESITPAAGTPVRCVFRLSNVSIVNGAQTAGAIATAAVLGTISPDAKILLTIIETGTTQDDIGLRITKARNHQNIVRGVDFAALDPDQERLRQETAIAGFTYYYRPSAEARIRRYDSFTIEDAALAISSLNFTAYTSTEILANRGTGLRLQNAIDFVVVAKKELGRLWEQTGNIYPALFHSELTGVRLIRLVSAYRFIDQILASTEQSETNYQRRMFFRHGRYFLMAIIGHRSKDVLQKAAITISTDDKTLLSQRVNELSEIVYAESEQMQIDKGYLSIFRNLTDSQPLADRVITRLFARDQEALAAQAQIAQVATTTTTITGNTN